MCTNEAIAFAQPNEDGLLDAIPLAEVMEIESMHNMDEKDIAQSQQRSTYGNAIDFTHAFQIRTDKQGKNAGRKYYLRADSEEAAATIISKLHKLSKVAREAAAAETQWDKIRARVRTVYDSSVFQGVAAFLIVGVSIVASRNTLAHRHPASQPPPSPLRTSRLPHGG